MEPEDSKNRDLDPARIKASRARRSIPLHGLYLAGQKAITEQQEKDRKEEQVRLASDFDMDR